ncbi:MAG: transposase [Candidatus Thermoplasmatota archaeon]|nr:transposase [Candidatus Thermoplasmatota archaeon]
MIQYKSAWEGLPIIKLSRSETRGTSILCAVFGLRTEDHGRMLHCMNCNTWKGRDVNACINQTKRGRTRLERSFREEKGPPGEAVKQFKDV